MYPESNVFCAALLGMAIGNPFWSVFHKSSRALESLLFPSRMFAADFSG
jgi:hypothetical protein